MAEVCAAAAGAFAAAASPDFATPTPLASPPPHVRSKVAPIQVAPPTEEWPRAAGGAGGAGSPAVLTPGKNAWQGARGSPVGQTPAQKVVTSVRRLMNKLPSTDSVRRSISDLEKRRRELRGAPPRGKVGVEELRVVEDRILTLRSEITSCDKRRGNIVGQLTAVEILDAECAGAFVTTFVAAILPASTKTRDDGGERALFEAPAQLCAALNNETAWPAALRGDVAEGEFRWGRSQFIKSLRDTCRENFLNMGLDNDAFAPHMKLVAHLIKQNVLSAGRIIPIAENVLFRRLRNAPTPESACACIKLLRLFLEIVASNPHDERVKASVSVLRCIANRVAFKPPLAFELPARAISEAQIYLDVGKAPSHGGWRSRTDKRRRRAHK
jgi:hypothetical protein